MCGSRRGCIIRRSMIMLFLCFMRFLLCYWIFMRNPCRATRVATALADAGDAVAAAAAAAAAAATATAAAAAAATTTTGAVYI